MEPTSVQHSPTYLYAGTKIWWSSLQKFTYTNLKLVASNFSESVVQNTLIHQRFQLMLCRHLSTTTHIMARKTIKRIRSRNKIRHPIGSWPRNNSNYKIDLAYNLARGKKFKKSLQIRSQEEIQKISYLLQNPQTKRLASLFQTIQ